jgi:hypothetical protein
MERVMSEVIVTREPGSTISEKLGASAGMWAVLWLCLHYLILQSAAASPAMPDHDYVRALIAERMRWEWATALRVMSGIMIVWFMGSLGSRLRLAEGEPGRLSSIAVGIGTIWGAIWLLSAMFNSVAIVLATDYQSPAGAVLAAILANQIVLILTPSLVFALTLATGFVAVRFGGFPVAYANATLGACGLLFLLTVVDWYGPGNLGPIILTLAFLWIAATSALLIPTYRPPDLVRGSR